jgi:hypothetical protein
MESTLFRAIIADQARGDGVLEYGVTMKTERNE